jgi:PBP1b-binding outer membrane lipoprotein LpoB
MKKLKTILATSLVLFLTSCSDAELEVKKVTETTKSEVEESVIETEVLSDFSNPALMYGSDFLSFFKALRKVGNYDEMVKFTSSESIEEFSVDYVKKYYKDNFTNMSPVKLTSMEKTGENYYTLHYVNKENATEKSFEIYVTVENDTSKLVLTRTYPI